MKLRAARLLSARRSFSSAPPPPATPSGRARRLFEIPEDPPELKAFKDRESRLIKDQLGRSKFLDAQRATGVDKVRLYAPSVFGALAPSPLVPTLAAVCRGAGAASSVSGRAVSARNVRECHGRRTSSR